MGQYVGKNDTAEPEDALVGSQKPKPRGFAALSPEARETVSSMGGRAAHASGVAHKFTSAEAQAAGRKGGAATHAKKKSRDTER